MGATAVELFQYNGIELLGSTFDALDILMYALGVLLAIIFDQLIFPRLFSFWDTGQRISQPVEETEQGMFTWRQS